ncbi:MAG: aspartate carbamoyltransferase [Methylovulum sp.]|nr:aspartate carbamoyltransferase [Methylovulum sp.]
MNNYPLIIIGLLLTSTTSFALEKANVQQIDDVHQRTQQVLPFDMNQTLQTFSKTVHGGVQHVVVKPAANIREIKRIQAYLLKLANDFRKGDFSDTERIHGANMPGLAQLKAAKTDDIKFEYSALEKGGQIHLTTEYPLLVQALHEWFDAQANEHGNDAIQEHIQHHTTPAE